MSHWLDLSAAAQPWLQQALQHLNKPFAVVELLAMACGLLGSLLLALKGRSTAWGWVLFAMSNVGWLAFSFGHSHWFMLIQQIGFSITSAIGIWKWLVEPAIERRFERIVKEAVLP